MPAVLVDFLVAVVNGLPAPLDYGVNLGGAVHGVGQYPGRAKKRGELDIDIRVFDFGLAGEPELTAEEFLGRRGCVEGLCAAGDLDDALVAMPSAFAGGGHSGAELVRVVEEGAAGRKRVGGAVAADLSAAGCGRALIHLPRRAVVELIVTAALEQPARLFWLALIAAAEVGGALVEAVLVRAAKGRLHVGMGGDAGEDARQAVEALLVLLGVDFGSWEGVYRLAYSSFSSGHLIFFCRARSQKINPPCDAICSRVKSVKIGAMCCIRSPCMSSKYFFAWCSAEIRRTGTQDSSCICRSLSVVAGARLKVCLRSELSK